MNLFKKTISSAVAVAATFTMAFTANASVSGSCGNPPTNCTGDLYRTSSTAVAVITTSGQTPDSTSITLSYTYRIPSGGPQVTKSTSGSTRAQGTAPNGCTMTSAIATYRVTNGGASWSDSETV